MKCPRFRRLFQHYSIDILIFQIYYIFTATAIVASNGLLLYRLLKKRLKKRADKMFIILSCSGIGVGLSSVPASSLPLFVKNFDALCMLSSILIFFGYIPYSFSWSVIIIIALDRVLLITKRYIYKKYFQITHLYCPKTYVLLLNPILAITVALDGEFLEVISFVVRYKQTVSETFFIIITIIAFMYLFYFVQLKSRETANNRHGGIDFDKKLMITITYTYICLLFFTFPYFAERIDPQPAITCSKLTIETLKQGVKYVQS